MGVLPICHVTLQVLRPAPAGYPANPKTFGEHLRKRRMDLGLFQRDAAAQLGASEASVWLWEKDRGTPELSFLPAILTFLGYDPQPVPSGLWERLVRYRKGRGWSQKRLAKELKVDPTTLSRWELGNKAPWGDYLKRVEQLLREG